MDLIEAMEKAIQLVRDFEGATAPNPPVAAFALDRAGNLLSLQAHQGAGHPHAEIEVLEDCKARGISSQIHTLGVTLEPCNHTGKTPPCTQAILNAGITQVVFGAFDPNPKVLGGGMKCLQDAGILVQSQVLQKECDDLIAPFKKWSTTQIPFITVKEALDENRSMIPPPGQKTFTSKDSLLFAHGLRKKSDAILTGVGTVLKDHPEFTVRHLPDFEDKQRILMVMDRTNRAPIDWIHRQEALGFKVILESDLKKAFRDLGSLGVHRVLVEAGPTLLAEIKRLGLWDEWITIQKQGLSVPDQIIITKNEQ
jgi:diaminohydroxyphosphoribosylaminopyrimidine deaminase/5-amino-6-(5-phosphoribosylamino)uracil reductase